MDLKMDDYRWTRYWCPREGQFRLTGQGYLLDPEQEGAHYYTDAVPFEQIADKPCLILLGEPGIGKSKAVKAHCDQAITQMGAEHAYLINLDQYTDRSEDRLIADIFQNERFLLWQEQGTPLHLFLDSFDECKMRISTLSNILRSRLRDVFPCSNLSIRIASRTANWSSGLEDELRSIWGTEAVGVYELAPLRKVDIESAAQAHNIASDRFLDEIQRVNVTPLAIKPVTLRFLLNKFQKDQQLPSSQAALYHEGCKFLCTETNKLRDETGPSRKYSPKQCLDAAAQIAAVMIFANRTAVWIGIDTGEIPDSDLILDELSNPDDSSKWLDERLIKEALDTGLFSARGPSRLGWAHQTYLEYLAAWYISQKKTPLKTILNLLTLSDDPTRKVIPQLRNTAAWIATLRSDVLKEIAHTDPEVLLSSDIATSAPNLLPRVVDGILHLYETKQQIYPSWESHQFYKRLKHPNLAKQLHTYIVSSEKNIYVRRVAIEIAQECEIGALQDDLLALALDNTQGELRKEAAYAVVQIADSNTKAKLRPLALAEAGEDPDDELKGCGLLATWPASISTEELFATLTPPKQEGGYGHYRQFLYSGFVDHVPTADLPLALRWVAAQPVNRVSEGTFQSVMNAIIYKAWQNLFDASSLIDSFTETALSRLLQYDPIIEEERFLPGYKNYAEEETFTNSLLHDNEKRRRVLSTALNLLPDPEKNLFWLAHQPTPLCTSDDLEWLLQCYQNTDDKNLQVRFIELAEYVFIPLSPEHTQILSAIRYTIPELYDRLVSRQIRASQFLEEQQQAQVEQQRQYSEQIESLYAGIEELLLKSENGNADAWWPLYVNWLRDPRAPQLHFMGELVLITTPIWENGEPTLRTRLLEAAKQYILGFQPNTLAWVDEYLEENRFYWTVYAGIAALCLLLHERLEVVEALPNAVWEAWVPFIVVYPIASESDDTFERLVSLAYQRVPVQMIDMLLSVMDRENQVFGDVYIIRRFENCWDSRLTDAVLNKATDHNLHPNSIRSILHRLLERQVSAAKSFAESIIDPPFTNDMSRERAVAAAQILMSYADDAGWIVVWPALQIEDAFAERVITGVSSVWESRKTNLGGKLAESQLADLYIWLANKYPHNEDEKPLGVHTITPRESIGDWRDSILASISAKGTYAAVSAIEHIASVFHDQDWMHQKVADARAVARQQLWMPLKPEELTSLLNGQRRRNNNLQKIRDTINVFFRPENSIHQMILFIFAVVMCIAAIATIIGVYFQIRSSSPSSSPTPTLTQITETTEPTITESQMPTVIEKTATEVPTLETPVLTKTAILTSTPYPR